jgi:hypothetical protein
VNVLNQIAENALSATALEAAGASPAKILGRYDLAFALAKSDIARP